MMILFFGVEIVKRFGIALMISSWDFATLIFCVILLIGCGISAQYFFDRKCLNPAPAITVYIIFILINIASFLIVLATFRILGEIEIFQIILGYICNMLTAALAIGQAQILKKKRQMVNNELLNSELLNDKLS